jgi:hypothetical protein
MVSPNEIKKPATLSAAGPVREHEHRDRERAGGDHQPARRRCTG